METIHRKSTTATNSEILLVEESSSIEVSVTVSESTSVTDISPDSLVSEFLGRKRPLDGMAPRLEAQKKTKLEMLKCTECGKTFSNKYNCERHMQKIHLK